MTGPEPNPLSDRRALIHGTVVVVRGVEVGQIGVLIRGASGTGKSDLALRLIDRGATLVSDDQVIVEAVDGRIMARAPERIAGRMEVRGVGLIEMPHVAEAPLGFCVDLGTEIERMPEPRTWTVAGIAIPAITIDPRPASAPIKVERALHHPIGRNDW